MAHSGLPIIVVHLAPMLRTGARTTVHLYGIKVPKRSFGTS